MHVRGPVHTMREDERVLGPLCNACIDVRINPARRTRGLAELEPETVDGAPSPTLSPRFVLGQPERGPQ